MATETLRPDAAGDETNITYQTPSSTFHWDKVDEAVADDGTTMVYSRSAVYERDLYNLPAHSGSGVINHIKIYARLAYLDESGEAKVSLKTNGSAVDGSELGITTSWVTYSQQWNTNPVTTDPWTWDEIDALQIGATLISPTGRYTYFTQIYVEVDYTPGWQGKINGVTNPAKINGIAVANIAKVNGVASS